MNKEVLKVSNIEKYYGSNGNITQAINNISFSVEEGEFIGIMGASGSGKTTLLNCISTIDKVTSGHIHIEGKDVTSINSKGLARFRRENLGFIFQDFNLLDTLTAYENIALALTIGKVNPSLVLADEPTGALDSKSAKMLLESLEELNTNLGATIMMVTHDAFTASYASRILFIKDGKIFNELIRGKDSRKEFFNKIIEVVTLLGGDQRDVF